MKKLALIAGAAALVFPAVASAKDTKASGGGDTYYTYKKVDANAPVDSEGEYRIEMQTEDDFRGPGGQRTFTTVEGEQLQIEGNTVYKVTAEGKRFYAPNGSYPVRNGQVVVVEDGLFDRIERAPEIVVLDMDRKKDRM